MADAPITDRPAVVIRQRAATVEDIEAQLVEHFLAARDALLAGRPVVFELSGHDLLGHEHAADAAVASALLGLARALALEGERPGWSVNVIARGKESAPDAAALAGWGVSGQLVHLDHGHLGRVSS
jgi:NAD(P)-dependent dehydrogenase (short-subunit alcohol dehydrogenase family)